MAMLGRADDRSRRSSLSSKHPVLGACASARDEAPDREHDGRTDDRADEACAFAGLVPADRLSEVGRHKRAHDPENSRQDKALGLVRAWHDELRDHARDKADDDGPDKLHASPPRAELPRRTFETFAATV